MLSIPVFLFLLLSVSSLECTDNKNYLKIVKKTTYDPSFESFSIQGNSRTLFNSPTLTDDSTTTFESCLEPTYNAQYSLIMRSSASPWTWANYAWIELYGVNDNIVFAGMMTQKGLETFPFSLYSPIRKGDSWYYHTDPSAQWKESSSVDASWTLVSSSNTISSSQTAYLRKTFAGLSGMAAVDVQFLYQHGIILYLNGDEILRDNLPSGEVTAFTPSSQSYQFIQFHGILRSSSIAERSLNVLAVELHFPQDAVDAVSFDGFVSFLAGLSSSNPCVVVPKVSTTSSSSSTFLQPANTVNWSLSRSFMAYSLPATIQFDFKYASMPQIDGVRIWTHTEYSSTVSDFSIEESVDGSVYSTLLASGGNRYAKSTWTQFNRVNSLHSASFVRLNALRAPSIPAYVNELQFLVCNLPFPSSIEYPSSSYVVYRAREYVLVAPTLYGFSGCSISPYLPQGLQFDEDTCTIQGIATQVLAQTTFSVSSLFQEQRIRGTVSLRVINCEGSLYRFSRSYQANPQNEFFVVRDAVSGTTLLDVSSNHNHAADREWSQYLCVSAERMEIVLDGSTLSWDEESYLFVYYVLVDREEELVFKGRFDELQGNEHVFFLRRPSIPDDSEWYVFSDGVPAHWYDASVTGWSLSKRGAYPVSAGVQLYKHSFVVDAPESVKGFLLSIRYVAGCVVYVNGREVWRNGVSGDVDALSTSSHAYASLMYRVVSLRNGGGGDYGDDDDDDDGDNGNMTTHGINSSAISGDTSVTRDAASATTLLSGLNTIAIAIIPNQNATTPNQNATTPNQNAPFDAMLRLMTDQAESHIWEFTSTFSLDQAFDMYYYTFLTVSSATNAFSLTLNNDRREWIGLVTIQNYYNTLSYLPHAFKLSARNSDSDPWTLLLDATNITFSIPGQKRAIYLDNDVPYNQFRFENIQSAKASTSCIVQSLSLVADTLPAEPTSLAYPSPIRTFVGIETAEVIPTGDGYIFYQVDPPLPDGLVLDPYNGWISGTPTVLSSASLFSITATTVTHSIVTVNVTLSVETCSNGQGLVTARIWADRNNRDNAWNLYDDEGSLLRSLDRLPVNYGYYYIDFCLPDGLYAFEAVDRTTDGWESGSGYTLTVDQGEMELSVEEVPSSAVKPIRVSTSFSSFFPFQVGYGDWKLYSSSAPIPLGWNTPQFDDSLWRSKMAQDLPIPIATTTYLRKSFTLVNVNAYQALNVRIKYKGGVAAYLNGNLVARFNLAEDFDANSESVLIHDESLFSKFHILLPVAGVVEGSNVIAFELHRPLGISSEPTVFDATGVFGVGECPTVVDSFASLTSSSLVDGTLADLMDLDPHTSARFNSGGSFVSWAVENQMGSQWDTFIVLPGDDVFSLNTQLVGLPDNTQLLLSGQQTLQNRVKHLMRADAMRGYVSYRWEFATTASLHSVHSAFCNYLPPDRLQYPQSEYAFCVASPVHLVPTVIGRNVVFSVQSGALPNGLSIHSATGLLSGSSNAWFNSSVVLQASNDYGSTNVTLHMTVHTLPNATYANPIVLVAVHQSIPSLLPSAVCPSCTYTVEGEPLPVGLALDSATGTIRGSSATELLQHSFTIRATNDCGTDLGTVTLSVFVPPALAYPYTSVSLPVGVPVSFAPLVNGTLPVFELLSGSLPAGLQMDADTGTIHGTPTESTPETQVVVRVSNAVGEATTRLTFRVAVTPTSLQYTQDAYFLVLGEPFTVNPVCDGTLVSYSVQAGSLPTGLLLESNGRISGTPTRAVSLLSVTIQATNVVGSVSRTLSFTVVAPPSQFAYPQTSYTLLRGEPFQVVPSVEGAFLSFAIHSGSLPTGLSLNATSGAIAGRPTEVVPSCSVTLRAWNIAGNRTTALVFSVFDAITSFQYPGSPFTIARGDLFSALPSITGSSFVFSVASGSLPAGLSLDASSGRISGQATQLATEHTLVIHVTNGASQMETTLVFTIQDTITSFAYPQSAYFVGINTTFAAAPTATGSSLVFAIESGALPAGLLLRSTDGAIQGVPSEAVEAQGVTVKVHNLVSSRVASVVFSIRNPPTNFFYDPSSFVLAKGSAFSSTPHVEGYDLSFSVSTGSLPSGLHLNATTGTISGVFDEAVRLQSVTIRATNIAGSAAAALSFTILSAPEEFSYPLEVYSIVRGSSFSIRPSVTGQQLSFSVAEGTLPQGLALNSTSGQISGVPVESLQERAVTIRVENIAGASSFTLRFSVLIPISFLSYSADSFTLPRNETFSVTPTITGDFPLFSVFDGALPNGLQLDTANGTIYGVPTESIANRQVTLKAENLFGVKTVLLTFTVLQRLSVISYEESVFVLPRDAEFAAACAFVGEGATFSLANGTLPQGLSLHPTSGLISGVPTESTTQQSVVVKAENVLGSVTTSLAFTVLQAISSFAYAQPSFVLAKNSPVSIPCEAVGESVVFAVVNGTLPEGLVLSRENGTIYGNPSVSVANQLVTVRAENLLGARTASLLFTVIQPITAFSYEQSTFVLKKDASFTMNPSVLGEALSFVVAEGSLPSDLSLNAMSGVISGVPSLFTVNQTVVIQVQNLLGSRSVELIFTVLTAPTAFAYPASSYVLERNVSMTAAPTVLGDCLFFSVQSGSLPVGLLLNTSSGVIEGRPTESVLVPRLLSVKAENAVGSVLANLSFEVLLRPSIRYAQDQYVVAVNASFVSYPVVTGDSVSFVLASGELPPGLSLDPASGVILGAPLAASESVVEVEAVNAVGRASTKITFRVLLPISAYSYPQTSYRLVKGTAFSVFPTIRGDSPVYSIATGMLPSGLTLNNRTGEISGAPTSMSSVVAVVLQARNEVGFLQTSLQFEVVLMSSIMTTIVTVLGVMVVIALLILLCWYRRKNSDPSKPQTLTPKVIVQSGGGSRNDHNSHQPSEGVELLEIKSQTDKNGEDMSSKQGRMSGSGAKSKHTETSTVNDSETESKQPEMEEAIAEESVGPSNSVPNAVHEGMPNSSTLKKNQVSADTYVPVPNAMPEGMPNSNNTLKKNQVSTDGLNWRSSQSGSYEIPQPSSGANPQPNSNSYSPQISVVIGNQSYFFSSCRTSSHDKEGS